MTHTTATPNFAKDKLREYVDRVERLNEAKASIGDDIAIVMLEAKGQGFDTKIMRQVIRLRQMPAAEREEREALLDLYLSATGDRE